MKRLLVILIFAAAHEAFALPVENPKMVMSIPMRNAILEKGSALLRKPTENFLASIRDVKDPFNKALLAKLDAERAEAQAMARPDTPEPVVHLSDKQALEAIGPKVVPSGTVAINGEDFLLFGQKRLKVGDILTITYQNRTYLIEIASIGPNSFTIRLNNEELVRPIK